MRAHLLAMCAAAGMPLAGFYYCPHAPIGVGQAEHAGCRCRKPRPGLLLDAADQHGIDLRRSWMVGDILDDVEAGRRAGCRTVLIDNGNETEWAVSRLRVPDYCAPDLGWRAACWLPKFGRQTGCPHESELTVEYGTTDSLRAPG